MIVESSFISFPNIVLTIFSRSFFSGLITHYQADSIMHPYINYLSHNKKRIKEIDKHFEIETYIDNYYMKENNAKH